MLHEYCDEVHKAAPKRDPMSILNVTLQPSMNMDHEKDLGI